MVMDISSITDADLKARLKAFGQDVPPITDQTRSTLKRRLTKLMAASPNTGIQAPAKGGSLPRSDSPLRRTRQTPPVGPSRVASRTPSPPIAPLPRRVEPSVSPRRAGRTGAALSSDEEDEGSSSSSLHRRTNVTAGTPLRGNTDGLLWGTMSSSLGGESSGSSSQLQKDNSGFSRWFNTARPPPKTSTPTDSRSTYRLQDSFGALTPIRDEGVRHRHPLGRQPLGSFDNVDSEVSAKPSGGFLGGMFGGFNRAADPVHLTPPAKDSRYVRHSPARPRPLQFSENSRTEDGGWASSWTSWLIVLAALVFFVLVGIMYTTMNWNASDIDNTINQYQIEGRSEADKLYQIRDHEEGLIPARADGQKLYNQMETMNALQIASTLSRELARLKGDAMCGDLDKFTMAVPEARSFALSAVPNVQATDFSNAIDLIVGNPHWGIKALDSSRRLADSASDVRVLESEFAAKGFLCRLKEAVATMLFKIVMAVFIVAATTAAAFGLWKYYQRRNRYQELVFDMANKILALVQKHHDQAAKDSRLKPYVAISHIRESLVPHGRQRSYLLSIFNEAAQYLNSSDSRLRVETQPINGEDFEVWVWNSGRDAAEQPDSTEPDTSSGRAVQDTSRSKDRAWTGGASRETRPELLTAATSCLKVRGFFNGKNENQKDRSWVDEIEDAIMERCHGVARIADIKVDPTSEEGVVYIKMMSKEDARNAYLAMHGQYFDSNLVNVKFLKPERYHQRFPDAVNKSTPLSHKTK